MADQQVLTAPPPVAAPSPEGSPRRWLTPIVWLVVLAVIGVVVVMSWSSSGSTGLLYNSQNQHGWFIDMIFHPTSVAQKLAVMVLAIALFIAVMALILWLIDRPRVPNGVLVAGFLGPVVIALASGLLWSAIKTIVASFQKFDQYGTLIGWAGLANYKVIFTGPYRDTLINTILWIFLVPIVATGLGLAYAVMVDRTRFESFAKALVFIPTAISMVAASVIWKYVYFQPAPEGSPQVGLLNAVWKGFGGTPKYWTTDFPLGTFMLIIVMIWIQAGFCMTVLSAAIKAVPDDIIEAAKIDGATGWRLFRSVTVPTIRPTLVVVLTTVAIASLKTFDIVNVMGGNIPSNNIVANAFYNAMAVQQNGWAGAFAVIIFIVVTPVIVFNVIQMRKSEAQR
jgi:alpha-glucoside transport system permease protein